MKITVLQVKIEMRNQFAIILWNFYLQIGINKTGNPAKCRKVGRTYCISLESRECKLLYVFCDLSGL